MIEFVQVNLKKAFIAAVELNKTVRNLDDYVVLATETYNFKGKIRALPPRSKVVCAHNPRAALICSPDSKIIKLERLTTRDCAVGLLQAGGEKIIIASVYLDIKMNVIQPWLRELITFICLLYTSPSPRDS